MANDRLPGGAFVWLPDFFPDLQEAGRGKLDLEATLRRRGHRYAVGLASRYGLTPAGRAGRYLAEHGVGEPWQGFDTPNLCQRRLTDTSHFHVDLQGQYVPGLCAGIVLPITDVPGSIGLDRYPYLAKLLKSGPAGLAQEAMEKGFVPEPTYASPCDLCTEVRRWLYPHAPSPELGPSGFYDVSSFR